MQRKISVLRYLITRYVALLDRWRHVACQQGFVVLYKDSSNEINSRSHA